MKKILSILLIAVMLASLIACGNAEKAKTNGTDDAPSRKVADDGLPELDFDGETVNFLSRTSQLSDISRDTLTNDVFNDAIYNMNETVQSRLNIKLKHISIADPEVTITSSVLTGVDEYQIVGMMGSFATHTAISVKGGAFLNLIGDRVKYIDTEQPWWNESVVEAATVYGICPIITGDLSVAYTKEAVVTFFNKNILEENGISEDMYALVKNGKWTYEKLLSLIKGTYCDITGDGKTDDDRYGLSMFDSDAIHAEWSAFDISIIEKTEDGGIALTGDNTKLAEALEKLYELCFENGDVNCMSRVNSASYKAGSLYDDELVEAFSEDLSLFITTMMRSAETEAMRNMANDYGIIPMPKWDEAQDEYYTYIAEMYVNYAIPKTVQNPDAVSATLEALAIEAYKYVQPAYYDKVLRGRYTRDLESREMIEYIMTHVKLDTSWIHAYAIGKLPHYALCHQLNERHSKSFTSFWRANKSKYNKAISDFLEAFETYEN